MATYSLSGSGTQTLTTGTGALYVTITTLPSGSGHGDANPTDYYGIGLIRPGNATAYWEPFAVIGGPQWMPVPYGTTRIGYALLDGAVVSAVEVAGSSPLAFPLASLPDVALASVADAQVLTYQASSSKWINATPTGGGGGTYPVTIPSARVYRNSDQAFSASTWTTLTFNAERWDNNNIHDTSVNTGRLTCRTAGKYLIIGNTETTGGSNHHNLRVLINGTNEIANAVNLNANQANRNHIATIWDMAVNDYAELQVWCSSNNTVKYWGGTSIYTPEFMMSWLGA